MSDKNNSAEIHTCPVQGIESGFPVIGLGIVIILFAAISFLIPAMPPLPPPITLIFIGFGIFLVWIGLTK